MPGASTVAREWDAALHRCDTCKSYEDLSRAFDQHCTPILRRCLSRPLACPVTEKESPAAASPDAAALREALLSLPAADDVWFFVLKAASGMLHRDGRKRSRDDVVLADVIVNTFVLFYGYQLPSLSAMRIRWAMLKKRKEEFEASDAYVHGNAGERRKHLLHSVLSVFSERAHRHYFSALWTSCLSSPEVPAALHLHLLYRLSSEILPFLTNPLVVADYLSSCFRSGGLLAVLALQGIFILILDHGLEYPEYYNQLYSLINADAFSSRHRYDLFRLVDVSLTSLRAPSYIAGAFAKRILRVSMVTPTPTLYFALPVVRKIIQRHPNCLALIHRTSACATGASGGSSAAAEEGRSSGEEPSEVAAMVAALFDGKDPYDPHAAVAKCNAMSSTLWELTCLEQHFLPAVPLMVSAFASGAEDNAPLKFEKTYARMFTSEVTRPMSEKHLPTVAYTTPRVDAADEHALLLI